MSEKILHIHILIKVQFNRPVILECNVIYVIDTPTFLIASQNIWTASMVNRLITLVKIFCEEHLKLSGQHPWSIIDYLGKIILISFMT